MRGERSRITRTLLIDDLDQPATLIQVYLYVSRPAIGVISRRGLWLQSNKNGKTADDLARPTAGTKKSSDRKIDDRNITEQKHIPGGEPHFSVFSLSLSSSTITS
jgi:hypothetical protein